MSEQTMDADERNELDALRLENDTLRRNLGRLEEKLRSAEEHAQAHAEASQPQGRVGTSGMGQSAPLEVRQLNGILQWLNEAKADIVDNDQSKRQLKGDVRLLYDLLDRARRERRSYDTVVGRLEGSVAQAESRTVELEQEIRLQRRSFERVLRDDRNKYEARTEAAEIEAECRAEALKRVITWAKTADAKYADAFGRLSAQAEEIGAANLGDLEGLALDMSEEIRQICDDIAEAIQPRSPRVLSYASNVAAKRVEVP